MREQNKSVRAASGFDHYGKQNSGGSYTSVNEGLSVRTDSAGWANQCAIGSNPASSIGGTSNSPFPVTTIAGFVSQVTTEYYGGGNHTTPIKFPEAPDGTVTYNSATGEVIQHADAATAFALADTSDVIEVVINRVDMFGAEFFLEEVSQTNPFVYPKGMIQSQTTSMNDIATTTSNRPVTYYAVYDGDTGSQGRGVDFWAATDEQKKALVSDETNNIFMLDDGRLVQWRMRQRTIVGAGNGDWENLNPAGTGSGASYLRYTSSQRVKPQGSLDSIPNSLDRYNSGNTGYYGEDGDKVTTGGQGHYVAVNQANTGVDTNIAVDGECYFHVWGVVPRLNQGAYHPSFNPLGAAALAWRDSSNGQVTWFSNVAAKPATSSSDCFIESTAGGSKSTNPTTGTIADAFDARSDERKYDAIYASGQGGVIDYRLPSWDMSSKEEASKVFQKVVNGTYRGKEKLIKTRVFGGVVPQDKGTFSGYAQVRFPAGTIESSFPQYQKATDVKVGGHFVDASNNIFVISTISTNSGGFDTVYFSTQLGNHSNNIDITGICYVIPIEELNSSVSGEFSMVDVVGKPKVILSKNNFANGWLGRWVPFIISNGAMTIPLVRKAASTSANNIFYSGGVWYTSVVPINTATNTITLNYTNVDNEFSVYSYTAFAKQTKGSTNKKVLNGSEGVGFVWASADNFVTQGNALIESLLGKVGKDNQDGNQERRFTITKHFMLPEGNLKTGVNLHLHTAVDLWKPLNDSPAVKTLWYQTANNQQASLNFAWSELVWQDDSPTVYTGSTLTSSIPKYERFYLAGQYGSGFFISNHGAGTYTFDQYMSDGRISLDTAGNISNSSGTLYYRDKPAAGTWGDNSTISITDGTATYTNLNGDTCLYGTAELSIPYGYTKNQARAAEQTEGVDL
ncbi:UNVERIFIED_ORG: hypothetical protein GCAPEGMB_00542 [Vibrio phage V07]